MEDALRSPISHNIERGNIGIAEKAQETRPGMSQKHMRCGIGIAS